MDIAAVFLVLLGLLFLLMAYVGLLRPQVFRSKKTGVVPGRWKLLGVGHLVAFIVFVVAIVIMPTRSEVKSEQTARPDLVERASVSDARLENVSQAPAVEPRPRHESLDLKPEAFRKKFNALVKQIDNDYGIAKFEIEKGEVNDSFKYMFGPELGLVGTVNKNDGSIRSLIFLVSGGGDMVKPVAVLLSATQTLNPRVAKEDNSKLVIGMIRKAIADIETGSPTENSIGDLHYTASASKLTGMMFAISQRHDDN